MLVLSFGARAELSEEASFSLRLTHTLFQGVIASHADEHQNFEPDQLANIMYWKAFLTRWSDRLDKGYESTPAIFSAIESTQGYLGREYPRWDGLRDFRAVRGRVSLEGYKEQFLDHVLRSESRFPKLEERVQYILEKANIFLVTSAAEYRLAQVIATPFLKSTNAKTRQLAEGILANIPFNRRLEKASLIFDLLGFLRGGTGLSSRLSRLWSAPRVAARFATQPVRWMGRKAGLTANPFGRRMSVSGWSALASTSLHAGTLGLWYTHWSDQVIPASLRASPLDLLPLFNLWDVFRETYTTSFDLPETGDFVPAFALADETTLVNLARARLLGETKLDWGDLFLSAEKIKGLDQRARGDNLVMHYADRRYHRLRAQVAQIFGDSGEIDFEQIEKFRRLVIEDALSSYKRDYPNLTWTFAGWGSNCVARTMLMISLLEPYQRRLPSGWRLVVAAYAKHLEPALWDGKDKYIGLMFGLEGRDQRAAPHRPEYLLLRLLRNYPQALAGLNNFSTRLTPPKHPGVKTVGTAAPSSRLGVLETARWEDFDDFDSDISDVQESSHTSYSEITALSGTSMIDGLSGRNDGVPTRYRPVVSLRRDPEQDIETFAYENDPSELTAYNEAALGMLLKKSREPGLTRERWSAVVRAEQTELLRKGFSHPLIRRLNVNLSPAADLESLLAPVLELSDADVKQYIHAREQIVHLAKVLQVADATEYFGNWENWAGHAAEGHLRDLIPRETVALFERASAVDESLKAQVINNPRAFLNVFGRASHAQRNLIIGRLLTFTAEGMGRSEQVKDTVQNFLSRLSEANVRNTSESNWLCDQVPLNLPVVPGWALTEGPARPCGTKGAAQAANSDKAAQGQVTSPNVLELSSEARIHLTLTFTTGLQIWDEATIAKFIASDYKRELMTVEGANAVVRIAYESDRRLQSLARYQPLSDFLNTFWGARARKMTPRKVPAKTVESKYVLEEMPTLRLHKVPREINKAPLKGVDGDEPR